MINIIPHIFYSVGFNASPLGAALVFSLALIFESPAPAVRGSPFVIPLCFESCSASVKVKKRSEWGLLKIAAQRWGTDAIF